MSIIQQSYNCSSTSCYTDISKTFNIIVYSFSFKKKDITHYVNTYTQNCTTLPLLQTQNYPTSQNPHFLILKIPSSQPPISLLLLPRTNISPLLFHVYKKPRALSHKLFHPNNAESRAVRAALFLAIRKLPGARVHRLGKPEGISPSKPLSSSREGKFIRGRDGIIDS